MCSFPEGFEQQKCILSQFWRPKSLLRVGPSSVGSLDSSWTLSLTLPALGGGTSSLAASPQALPLLSHGILPVCLFSPSHEDIGHIGSGPSLGPHLDLMTSAKTLFPNQVTFTSNLGLRPQRVCFRGRNSTPSRA